MSMSFCLLNMSSPSKRLNIDPALGQLVESINSTTDIPARDPLILYIVGHAVPDGLMVPGGPDDANGTTISDAVVAEEIRAKRGAQNTLIIWDVCFAKSFLQTSGAQSWGPNYVHIFACQSYERTWNAGPSSSPSRKTSFSTGLQQTLANQTSQAPLSWDSLNVQLNAHFAGLQTAEIYTTGTLRPSDFPLV